MCVCVYAGGGGGGGDAPAYAFVDAQRIEKFVESEIAVLEVRDATRREMENTKQMYPSSSSLRI